MIHYLKRFAYLINLLLQALLLPIVAQKKAVVLLAQFTPQTGTHTYFKQVLYFLCSQGMQVTVLTHIDNKKSIEEMQVGNPFSAVYYSNQLDFFEYFGSVSRQSFFYLVDKFLPKLLFLIKVAKSARASHIWISSQMPTQFLYAFLLPIRINYVVHAILWGKADNASQFFIDQYRNNPQKKLITVSKAAANAISQFWNYPLTHIHVVPNAYTPVYTQTAISAAAIQRDIMCIGTLDHNKQPFLFIKLAALAYAEVGTMFKFVWLGDGPLLQECKQEMVSLPNIEFIGNVHNPDDYYSGVQLYVQLSKAESQGIAILGAMYHEIPCLVTKCGGPESMILEGKTGFLVDVDEKAEVIWGKIKEILKDNHTQIIQNAKILQTNHFSNLVWTKQMKTML